MKIHFINESEKVKLTQKKKQIKIEMKSSDLFLQVS